MKNQLPPNVLLAMVLFAAMAAVALWAVARQPGPRGVLGIDDQPQPDPGQMQQVFHELHAEGNHPVCEICGANTDV